MSNQDDSSNVRILAKALYFVRTGEESYAREDSRALLRAFEWLHAEAHYPAKGDDTWLPPIVNRA